MVAALISRLLAHRSMARISDERGLRGAPGMKTIDAPALRIERVDMRVHVRLVPMETGERHRASGRFDPDPLVLDRVPQHDRAPTAQRRILPRGGGLDRQREHGGVERPRILPQRPATCLPLARLRIGVREGLFPRSRRVVRCAEVFERSASTGDDLRLFAARSDVETGAGPPLRFVEDLRDRPGALPGPAMSFAMVDRPGRARDGPGLDVAELVAFHFRFPVLLIEELFLTKFNIVPVIYRRAIVSVETDYAYCETRLRRSIRVGSPRGPSAGRERGAPPPSTLPRGGRRWINRHSGVVAETAVNRPFRARALRVPRALGTTSEEGDGKDAGGGPITEMIMFDATSTPASTTDWRDQVRTGDVVLFRFPTAEEDDAAVKARPCLVLEVEDRAGRRFVEIAYGTSRKTAANRGAEIRVRQPEARAIAGLVAPTRFVGSRRLTVSVDSDRFDTNGGERSPIIGRLDEVLLERMHAVRARIQAMRDIVADRREQRRRERRASEAETSRRPFIVERRRLGSDRRLRRARAGDVQ